jgi:hypothetical protein
VPKVAKSAASSELVLDARKLTTRQLNSTIRAAISKRKTNVRILNPDARHNLAVGMV